jgi:hypothetical protein
LRRRRPRPKLGCGAKERRKKERKKQRTNISLISKNLKIKIYETVILQVVLYGCETWSLTLREGHRLTVFEKSVLRRTFGPKREEKGS